jgi:hypothetical protein
MSKKPKNSASRKVAETLVRGQPGCEDHVTSVSKAREHPTTEGDANPRKKSAASLQEASSTDELVRDLEDSGYPVDGTDHSQK